MYMYLLDTSEDERRAAKEAFSQVFGPDSITGREVRVLEGQYGVGQLKGWYGQMINVITLPGVAATDIYEAKNRLWIGLERGDAQDGVEAELTTLGIPREAVIIQVIGSPVLDSHSLQDSFTEVEGGIQIQVSGRGRCSLGFITKRSGEMGFVTASHCTSQRGGGADLGVFYQPDTAGTAIGYETIDPSFFDNSEDSDCPVGRQCRYSDSAFIKLYHQTTGFDRGAIARPVCVNCSTNELNIDHSNPEFRVVDDTSVAFGSIDGETVHKVGRSTGWTSGTITNVCVNWDASNLDGITYLCQNMVNYDSAGGDSGGPVFKKVDSPSEGDVHLYGIHVGHHLFHTTTIKFFSQLNYITMELDVNGSWYSCDPSFSC